MNSNSFGLFFMRLSRAEKKAAVAHGWKMSLECETIEGTTRSCVDLVPYRNRFDLCIQENQGGQTFLLTSGMVPELQGSEYPVQGGRRTHRYELIAPPGSRAVRVLIDDREIAGAYGGHADYQEDHGLIFGIARHKSERAEGITTSFRFEIL